MRKSRFADEQIIKVLKEHAVGMSAADVCRKDGISDASFYKWRSRFGGMEISDARKLKALEEENRPRRVKARAWPPLHDQLSAVAILLNLVQPSPEGAASTKVGTRKGMNAKEDDPRAAGRDLLETAVPSI